MKGGPTDFEFVTPDQALRLELVKSIEEANKIASDNRICMNCDNHVWRYGQTGLCFPCTTGESDASDDYEIGDYYA